jgi:hypothetical protein
MRLKSVTLAVLMLVATAGCGALDAAKNSANASLGTMTVKIDGKAWAATTGGIGAVVPSGLSNITVTGSNNGATEPVNTITIVITASTTGTYTIDQSKNTVSMATSSKSYKAKDGGKVTITKIDTNVEGTFEGSAVTTDGLSTITFTEGKFSAPKH